MENSSFMPLAPNFLKSLRHWLYGWSLAAGLTTGGLAQDSPVNSAQRVVIVTGIGIDENAARRNAYSRAVEEAVGVVVATDTIVNEEKVIHDQILTYSGALVSKSETLRSEQKDSLFEVKIRATVEMRPLLQRLKAANVAVREVSGESLFASTVTQLKERGDAQALIMEALRDFPLNVMRAEVWGQPQIIKSDGQKATLACKVGLTIDRARFTEFSTRLRTALRQTGHQSIVTQLVAINAPPLSELPGFGARKLPGMFSPFPKYPTDAYYLFVHAQSDPSDSRSAWELYRVRPELAKTLFLLSVNSLRLTIQLLDGIGQEVMRNESGLCFNTNSRPVDTKWSLRSPISFAFGQSSVDRVDFGPLEANETAGLNKTFRGAFNERRDNFIYIAPYFPIADGEQIKVEHEERENSWGLQRSYAVTCELVREIETPLAPIQTVKKVVASLSSDIPLPPDPKSYTSFLSGLSFDEPTRSEQVLTDSLVPGAMMNLPQPQAISEPDPKIPVPNQGRSGTAPRPSASTPRPSILPPDRGGLQPARGL
jgi:hypothetical protein